jgi:tRNA(fMet)-specific endonuclease VapC
MNGRYLLDTNIVIALFAKEKNILEELSKASETFIPSIVVGELYYGAYKSSHTDENITRITTFINSSTILPCDSETARFYGQVKSELKVKGKPIPENDIWISAIALQYDLTLAARDIHFKEVDKLKLITW